MQGVTFLTLHPCQIAWIWSNLVSKAKQCWLWLARDRTPLTEISKKPIPEGWQFLNYCLPSSPHTGLLATLLNSAKFLNGKTSTGQDFESPEQETKTVSVLYSDPSTAITGAESRQLLSWLHREGSSYNSPSRQRSKIILCQQIKQIWIRRQVQF